MKIIWIGQAGLLIETRELKILTHDHLDHLDPETLSVFFDTDRCITVLAPYNAWEKSRKYGREHNYVMFNSGTVWTQGNTTFTAVNAEHSDKTAVGYALQQKNI